jgi:hypothetical protein
VPHLEENADYSASDEMIAFNVLTDELSKAGLLTNDSL